MNRRRFFGRLLGGFAAAWASPALLHTLPAPVRACRPVIDLDDAYILEHYIRPACAAMWADYDRKVAQFCYRVGVEGSRG